MAREPPTTRRDPNMSSQLGEKPQRRGTVSAVFWIFLDTVSKSRGLGHHAARGDPRHRDQIPNLAEMKPGDRRQDSR